jgi:hypothetical protein
MLGVARRAEACSCFPATSIEDAIRATDSVLEARVTALRKAADNPEQYVVVLDVKKSHKGAPGPHLEVITEVETAMCGYPFQPGRDYLVYAHRNGERLEVGLCSRTRPIAEAADDLRVLGDLAPATPPRAPPQPVPAASPKAKAPPVEVSSRPVATGDEQGPQPRRGGCAGCAMGGSSRYGAALGALLLLVVGGLGWQRRRVS